MSRRVPRLPCCRPIAREAAARLDLQWRLGIDLKVVEDGKTPNGWLWFKRAKSKDPTAVALVKVWRSAFLPWF